MTRTAPGKSAHQQPIVNPVHQKLMRVSFALSTLIAGGLLFSCNADNAGQTTVDVDSQVQASQTTSSETAVSLDPSAVSFAAYDIDGNLHESSEWVGRQPIVINFWGTWCAPCRKEIPDLVRLYDEYEDKGIEIISFALNDRPASVANFAKRYGMSWVMLLGDPAIAMNYGGITGVPTTIFIGRDGKELGRFVGPRSYDTFKQAFDALLMPT